MNPDYETASRGGVTTNRVHLFPPTDDVLIVEWQRAALLGTPVSFQDKQWFIEAWETDSFDRYVAYSHRTLGHRYTFVLVLIRTTERKPAVNDPVVNRSLAVFLLNTPGLKAVLVTYEGFDKNDPKKPLGNLTMFKTFETDLKVGDMVIIPTTTRVGFTLAQIAQLDHEVDFESTTEVRWLAGKFDQTNYASIVGKELQIIDAVKEADKKARQEELKKRLLGNIDPNSLPVIDLTALPAPQVTEAKS